MAGDQKKKKQYIDNPIEQGIKDVVGTVAEPVKGIFDTALEQIGLKPQKKALSGEIDLTNRKIDQKDTSLETKLRQLQSVQSKEKQVYSASQKALEQQIGKIMQELAMEVTKLQLQTAELTNEVKSVTVATIPVKPGAYHLNYFEWVIGMLRDLRKRVNESRMWLKLWSKKKQQKGYWAMFKKHGTSFAMSEERAIASANG